MCSLLICRFVDGHSAETGLPFDYHTFSEEKLVRRTKPILFFSSIIYNHLPALDLCQPRIVGTTIVSLVMVTSNSLSSTFLSSLGRLTFKFTLVLTAPFIFLAAQQSDMSFVSTPSTSSITAPASRLELNAGVASKRLDTVSIPFCFEISIPMPVNALVIICSKSCTCLGQTITV